MPVYNVKEEYLRESIDSVLQQYYPHWELCISDDNSSEPHIKRVLEEYAAFDPRIKVRYREENGHISACSNSALEMAAGEFTAFLDNDDVLAPFALYEVVRLLNTNKELDLIYSDEDKLLNGKRCYPFFKKQFNMDLLKQMNYICHLAVYRTALVKQVGGLRINYEGVQDWDLAIRIINLSKRVAHIPKILYHWRISDTSTSSGEHHKPYVKAARKRMRDDLNILF
ncbi:glycosyltransferase family 2 protein [Paenibacillus durus]|uniref:glycosyltransferase family 2 protein n=1 Tax=Paenibacillus durus TaxID=44251 RepID=UPI0011877263|nr:glycosyltransferase [Paenibacillus durus]